MGSPIQRLTTYSHLSSTSLPAMDAIRKKMKSLKDETDGLYNIINKFEDETKESNAVLAQAECDIRDYGKKVHGFEIDFDETLDKLNKANESYEEKDKILSIQNKYKMAEGRFEYGEMNITKLNQRIDDIEDEIYREKLKIKKVADELGDTFDDMLAHY